MIALSFIIMGLSISADETPMGITVYDVALRAGVSPITVSRTFSGTRPVAEGTRRKVLAAAAELGYIPNLLARGLVQKSSPLIGVMVLELANPFFVPIIDAVQAMAREHDHMVIISQSQRRLDIEQASLIQFRQIHVAGVLVTPASIDLSHLRSLHAEGTPVVVMTRCWPEGDYVTVNNFAGGHMVGEHLLGLRHNTIACVTHGHPTNSAVQARVQGFRAALEEGGCILSDQFTIHVASVQFEDAVQAADIFLSWSERPTAIFLTADHLAIGFIHRLREQGVRVPEDVAVIGYDDIRYAEFLEVPLTTVALPKYEIGRRAIELLFERLTAANRHDQPYQILLDPKLVVRQSCGARLADL